MLSTMYKIVIMTRLQCLVRISRLFTPTVHFYVKKRFAHKFMIVITSYPLLLVFSCI